MKKIILSGLLLFGAATAFAQCDKKVQLTSSTTEYLDASGNVTKTEEEKSTVQIRKDTIIISPGNEPQSMTGIITSHTCNWTVPYKEGKSTIKAQLSGSEPGEVRNVTITIEGKGVKLTMLALMDEVPDRQIRLPMDTFEEKG